VLGPKYTKSIPKKVKLCQRVIPLDSKGTFCCVGTKHRVHFYVSCGESTLELNVYNEFQAIIQYTLHILNYYQINGS
jgi:hypothetical protein